MGAVRAAYIEELGRPSVIRYGALPDPVPGPTDVLVAVEAVTVNHVDTFVRSGAYPTPTPFPFVIGRDMVGRVAVSGGGFAVGERVWCNSLGHGGRQGSFSSLAVVPADRLYPLPDGVAATDAVPVFHPVATAYLGLFRHGGLSLGSTVYVGGAAGNVGDAAVRLAAASGARVLASARTEDFASVRAAGAVEVFDYRDVELHARLGSVDLYWDTSGHHDLRAAVPVLAHGGRIVLSAALGAHPELPVGALYTRDASLRGFVISNASVADLAAASRVINHMLAAGALPARVAAVLPLSEARRAHEVVEAGELSGRRVVLVTASGTGAT